MNAKIELNDAEFERYKIAMAVIDSAENYGYITVHSNYQKSEYGQFFLLKKDDVIIELKNIISERENTISHLTNANGRLERQVNNIHYKIIYKTPTWALIAMIVLAISLLTLFIIR